MATYYSSASNGFRLKLDLTQQSQSIQSNSSVVKWVLSLEIGGSYFVDYRTLIGAHLDGSSVYSYDNQFNCTGTNRTQKISEGTKTIYHNQDGSKTFNFSAYFETNSKDGYTPQSRLTISGSFQLTKIPRYANITELKSNGVGYDLTIIHYATDVALSKVELSTNGGNWIDITSSLYTSKVRGTHTNQGLTPNTTFTYKIRVTRADNGLMTESNPIVMKTWKLLALTSNNSVLDTNTKKIAISGDGVDLRIACQSQNNEGGWVTFKTTGELKKNVTSIQFTQSEVDAILSRKTNSKTVLLRFVITSIWFGEAKGTTISPEYTYNFVNVAPTIANVSYIDPSENTALQALKGGNQVILQGISDCKVTIGQAQAKKGATISSYQIAYFGKNYHFNGNGQATQSNATYTITKPQAPNDSTLNITVTDSRGFTAQTNITVHAKPYHAPQILIAEARRQNGYEQSTRLIGSARAHQIIVNGQNTLTYSARWRYKERTLNAQWSTYFNLPIVYDGVDGLWQKLKFDVFAQDFDNNKEFEIEVQFHDSMTGYATPKAIILNRGIALLELYKDKIKIGKPLHALHTSVNPNFNADLLDGHHVDDFRLKNSIPIIDNQNLNYMKQIGFYRCSLSATAKTLSNCPTQYAFSLEVIEHANDSVRQIVREYRSLEPRTYERNCYLNTWGAWVEVLTTHNAKDYVIEQGAHYVKWASGRMEQTVSVTKTINFTNTWGSLFYTEQINAPDFTHNFVDNFAVYHSVKFNQWCGTFTTPQKNQKNAGGVALWRPVATSGTHEVTITFKAEGRWK